MTIIKIPNGKVETIANAEDKELTAVGLNYENITAFGFDGTSNMAGNIGGVKNALRESKQRSSLYTL